MDKQGKWEFLRPVIEEYRQSRPDLSLAGIAANIVEEYEMSLSPEQMRKIVSSLINRKQNIYKHTPTVNPTQIVEPKVNKAILHTKITRPGNYLVLGCWHVPFHNQELTKRVYDLLDTHQFEGLILNGDFLDCNTLSGHSRGQFTAIPGLTLNQEYTEGKVVLKQLIDLLPPNATKIFMYGNHENRYQRFVADMQNAKTPPPSPTEGLDLFGQGFQVVESYEAGYITLGQHLDILHGTYYNTHCAKTHIDRFRGSVLFAHTHRIQSYIEGRTGGFNIGWGGNVTSPAFNYADRGTKASWQNGFAVVTIDEKGNYYVQQVIAPESRFVYGGKQY